jgi:hypothetical protein
MSIPEAPEAFLFQRLTSQTAVSSLIGSRVYPLIAPQGTPLPLVVYQRTSVERPQSAGGFELSRAPERASGDDGNS